MQDYCIHGKCVVPNISLMRPFRTNCISPFDWAYFCVSKNIWIFSIRSVSVEKKRIKFFPVNPGSARVKTQQWFLYSVHSRLFLNRRWQSEIIILWRKTWGFWIYKFLLAITYGWPRKQSFILKITAKKIQISGFKPRFCLKRYPVMTGVNSMGSSGSDLKYNRPRHQLGTA